MCVFLISPVPIAEPLTSELIDTPVFYNLAPRPIKYRVSVPIPSEYSLLHYFASLGWRKQNLLQFVGKMCLTVCGMDNCAVRFVTLLMKNVAKLSAVRVYEGGGGGGQTRKENVLKSMRELGELLILSGYYVLLAVETLAEKSERSRDGYR